MKTSESRTQPSMASRYTVVASLALSAGIILGGTLASGRAQEPKILHCSDAQVASGNNGSFAQAAELAGMQGHARPGADYSALGKALSDDAKSPSNPHGVAYQGESVSLMLGPNGSIKGAFRGACGDLAMRAATASASPQN